MAQVLRQLTPQTHPDLLVGTETSDDAGVFRLNSELALVQTTDFFPPLVDDPYRFGQIAAANALSDVYAMGGQPITAMNLVAWPDKELPYDWLVEILRGGADKVREAGAVIVGGHSVRDVEVKYGLAVTGTVHPARVWTNAGARPDDRLVLTKPIGSGVLCSAAKSGRIPAGDLTPAIELMCALNRPGRDAGLRVGVNACTDVTGFGLIGHAFEMALGARAAITIEAAAVPLLPRALELAREGVVTRAHKTTRAHLGDALDIDLGVEAALANLLLDAQTSGGLLLSVPEARCDELVRELMAQGALCAAVIGRVEASHRPAIRLRA